MKTIKIVFDDDTAQPIFDRMAKIIEGVCGMFADVVTAVMFVEDDARLVHIVQLLENAPARCPLCDLILEELTHVYDSVIPESNA